MQWKEGLTWIGRWQTISPKEYFSEGIFLRRNLNATQIVGAFKSCQANWQPLSAEMVIYQHIKISGFFSERLWEALSIPDICHRPTGARALDTGQFRFWSKFKVPSCVQKLPSIKIWDILCNIWWTKWGFFIPNVKKWISKIGKIRKWPKTANFGHVLVFLSD